MPFSLDSNPTPGEISEALNYLLGNAGSTYDLSTGQVLSPTGGTVGYLYKYIHVKYSDSFDGTLNFSNTPTNRNYYGIRNNDSSTESTNPADYVWYKVTGGFGTTKSLYYLTTGGRSIQFSVATSTPNAGWLIDPGTAIDLDVTTATNAVANFVVIRVANNSAAPTDAECITAIGRTPTNGDICTINYNSGINSIVYKYTTGWAIFQKYITGDLIVANTILGNNIAANTITGGNISATTINTNNLIVGSVSAPYSYSAAANNVAITSGTSGITNQLITLTTGYTWSGGRVVIGFYFLFEIVGSAASTGDHFECQIQLQINGTVVGQWTEYKTLVSNSLGKLILWNTSVPVVQGTLAGIASVGSSNTIAVNLTGQIMNGSVAGTLSGSPYYNYNLATSIVEVKV